MGKNRLVFIAFLLIFLINAGLCWGAAVMPGHDTAAVFENRIDTVVVIVVVKSSNNPDMGLLFAWVICSDGLNWYVYCGNNPMVFVDITGLFEIETPLAAFWNAYVESQNLAHGNYAPGRIPFLRVTPTENPETIIEHITAFYERAFYNGIPFLSLADNLISGELIKAFREGIKEGGIKGIQTLLKNVVSKYTNIGIGIIISIVVGEVFEQIDSLDDARLSGITKEFANIIDKNVIRIYAETFPEDVNTTTIDKPITDENGNVIFDSEGNIEYETIITNVSVKDIFGYQAAKEKMNAIESIILYTLEKGLEPNKLCIDYNNKDLMNFIQKIDTETLIQLYDEIRTFLYGETEEGIQEE